MGMAPTRVMNDGRELPVVGIGTYKMTDAAAGVRAALRAGYRLVDTASAYGNEDAVGKGIATSGLGRHEIVVTTKLRGLDQGYESALRAFEESRKRLGLEYVDLFLIHWPLPRLDRYIDSWRAMIKLRDDGVLRSVGVSNFTPAHLGRLVAETGIVPAVNQIELHPHFTQDAQLAYDTGLGIVTQAWQPLARKTALLSDPVLAVIADRHQVKPAQVVLRWHLQRGVVPIPKSSSPARQQANLDVFGFELTTDEMVTIAARPQSRSGGDPDVDDIR
ncbi:MULTISPECIES: aldo/keto reductase [unclassified Pseudofrankia]|uniref:aldo/keto reductase n=1 Tax=unclassified Pseudofrankia TaxID=2994372 RepID=UPI0008DA9BBF|nr:MULTISPECIES: aldo/keto reductase [unclassified Pseudofrankia]MDT3439137.1 aldo/keto reductase [Pseudofrankia sp. BMG5.37]OHV45744.1 aldo/keto reductase [Pseudofrankia sp. BMG5.36]